MAFARSQGMRLGNQERRLLLDLPPGSAARTAAASADDEIEVRTWRGACPQELIEDWARLSTQMEADVPMGDLTRPASRSDVEEIRRTEQRMEAQGWILVRALAYDAEAAVGYTEMLVSRHDPEIITQDDTLVDRAHRGRGIGRGAQGREPREPRRRSREHARPLDPDLHRARQRPRCSP